MVRIFFADFKNVAPFRESPYKKGFFVLPPFRPSITMGEMEELGFQRGGMEELFFLAHPIPPPPPPLPPK